MEACALGLERLFPLVHPRGQAARQPGGSTAEATPDAGAVPVYDNWRPDELALIIAGTRTMEMPLTERLRAMTLIQSGGRKEEMLGLQLGHFDLFNRTVTVTGKGS